MNNHFNLPALLFGLESAHSRHEANPHHEQRPGFITQLCRVITYGALASILAACGGGGDPAAGERPTDCAVECTGASAQCPKLPTVTTGSPTPRPATSPRASVVVLTGPVVIPPQPSPPTGEGVVQAPGFEIVPTLPGIDGFQRSVPQTETVEATAALLSWQPIGQCQRAAAISLRSPQAVDIWLGLEVFSLPREAVVRVYAQNSTTNYVFLAQDLLDSLDELRRSGIDGRDARLIWLSITPGDEATLEIDLPLWVDSDQVKVAMPLVGHGFGSRNFPTSTPAKRSSRHHHTTP